MIREEGKPYQHIKYNKLLYSNEPNGNVKSFYDNK